jgi:hypothetical protein
MSPFSAPCGFTPTDVVSPFEYGHFSAPCGFTPTDVAAGPEAMPPLFKPLSILSRVTDFNGRTSSPIRCRVGRD